MATQQEILTGLAEIVNEVAGVPSTTCSSDKSFIDDLDIDSLSMVEVVVAAEEQFGVKIPDDDVKDLKHRRRRRHLHREGQRLSLDATRGTS